MKTRYRLDKLIVTMWHAGVGETEIAIARGWLPYSGSSSYVCVTLRRLGHTTCAGSRIKPMCKSCVARIQRDHQLSLSETPWRKKTRAAERRDFIVRLWHEGNSQEAIATSLEIFRRLDNKSLDMTKGGRPYHYRQLLSSIQCDIEKKVAIVKKVLQKEGHIGRRAHNCNWCRNRRIKPDKTQEAYTQVS